MVSRVYLKQPEITVLCPSYGNIEFIKSNDIIFIESDNIYCDFHLTEKRIIKVLMPLKEYDEILPRHLFKRIHKRYIVNVDMILQYQNEKSKIITIDNHALPLARSRKHLFFASFTLPSDLS